MKYLLVTATLLLGGILFIAYDQFPGSPNSVELRWQEEIRLSSGETLWLERTLDGVHTRPLGDPGVHFHLTRASLQFIPTGQVATPSPWQSSLMPVQVNRDPQNNEWYVLALWLDGAGSCAGNPCDKPLFREFRFRDGRWQPQTTIDPRWLAQRLPHNLLALTDALGPDRLPLATKAAILAENQRRWSPYRCITEPKHLGIEPYDCLKPDHSYERKTWQNTLVASNEQWTFEGLAWLITSPKGKTDSYDITLDININGESLPRWQFPYIPVRLDRDPDRGEWRLIATWLTTPLGKEPYLEFRLRNRRWQHRFDVSPDLYRQRAAANLAPTQLLNTLPGNNPELSADNGQQPARFRCITPYLSPKRPFEQHYRQADCTP